MKSFVLSLSILCCVISNLSFAKDLSVDELRHFIHRTGFAENPKLLAQMRGFDLEEIVRWRIENTRPSISIDAPDWATNPTSVPNFKHLDRKKRKVAIRELRKKENLQLAELRSWWVRNIVVTQNPLRARMTLFWQNHFTSDFKKVRKTRLMYKQLRLLEKHAVGNFGDLLLGILEDPAMNIYLDNHKNNKSNPNENLARELLELFTFGEGHYSELDVKESARALTGYSIDREGTLVFRQKSYDKGDKTIFGVTSKFGVESLVQHILSQPRTAEYIVEKLWREFVSIEPDKNRVTLIAQHFRSSNYDLSVLLSKLFMSPEFWSKDNRASLLRSPVNFVASTIRLIDTDSVDVDFLVKSIRSMGQLLFNPPDVAGWRTHTAWINSLTLQARQNFTGSILKNPHYISMMGSGSSATMDMSETRDHIASTKHRKSMYSTVNVEMSKLMGKLGDEAVLPILNQQKDSPKKIDGVPWYQKYIVDYAWHLY